MLSMKHWIWSPSWSSSLVKMASYRVRGTSSSTLPQQMSRWLTTPAPATAHESVDPPKPYEEIPGPKGYPFIGTVLDYTKDKYTMSRVIKRRYDKFGPIYKEAIFPGLPEQVMIFDPKDIETVFRADKEWPKRPEGGDLFKRLIKESGVTAVGILSAQNEEWHDARVPMSKFMMVPRKVAEYHEGFNDVTFDLMKNIDMKKDAQTSLLADVPKLLFNWSFESVSLFILGKRLGALSASGDVDPDCKQFIESTNDLFQSLTDLFFSIPLYKLYRTKLWKHIVKANISVNQFAQRFINEKLAEIEEEDRKILEAAGGTEEAPDSVDFLTYLVHSGKMDIEHVTSNIVDLLSAGVETTSYTLAWCLYSIASNPEVQEKLREEVVRVVGDDRVVTPAHINDMNYLRNILKETQRMYPLAGFNQRILQQDVVLSGYMVPEGTEVTMPQTIIGRLPHLFSEPDRFMPERWSKENKSSLPSMFAQLPFGFGPRMCMGRRVAELEIHIALAHLVRSYQVEYLESEPMDYVQSILLKPERQLDLVFKKL